MTVKNERAPAAGSERATGRALASKGAVQGVATTVAKTLRISVEEADAALTRLADGMRVSVEVDENVGAVHYVFHEVQGALPKTRVAVEPTDDDSAASAAEDAGQAPAVAEKKARRL